MIESRLMEARPGGKYTATVWTRSGDQGSPGIYLSFRDSSGVRVFHEHARIKESASEWGKVQIEGRAPANAHSVRVSLYSFLKDRGTIDFDDVSLHVTGGEEPSSVTGLNPKRKEVVEIGSRRELFVDRYLIDDLKGLRFVLHHPRDEGPVLTLDKPWEGHFCGYSTVLTLDDGFRLYYRGRPGVGADGDETETTCVAESADGITWIRPNLGIHEVNGTRDNNVVLAKMSTLLAQLFSLHRYETGGCSGLRSSRGSGESIPRVLPCSCRRTGIVGP